MLFNICILLGEEAVGRRKYQEEQEQQARSLGEKAAAKRRCKGERERLDRKRAAKVMTKKASRSKMEKDRVAKEPSFKQRGCPDPRSGEQLDRDVSSKGRIGSKDSVSSFTTCVNLYHTKLSRCLFRTMSLKRQLLTRTRLKKKTSPPRAGLGSSWT